METPLTPPAVQLYNPNHLFGKSFNRFTFVFLVLLFITSVSSVVYFYHVFKEHQEEDLNYKARFVLSVVIDIVAVASYFWYSVWRKFFSLNKTKIKVFILLLIFRFAIMIPVIYFNSDDNLPLLIATCIYTALWGILTSLYFANVIGFLLKVKKNITDARATFTDPEVNIANISTYTKELNILSENSGFIGLPLLLTLITLLYEILITMAIVLGFDYIHDSGTATPSALAFTFSSITLGCLLIIAKITDQYRAMIHDILESQAFRPASPLLGVYLEEILRSRGFKILDVMITKSLFYRLITTVIIEFLVVFSQKLVK